MPLYDYRCDCCGDFRDWQAMARSQEPVDCPTCGRPARRRVATPFIAFMPSHTRIAHQRNEKSAHEPKVMTRGQLDRHAGGVGACGAGACGAGHSHNHTANTAVRGPEPGLRRSSKRTLLGH